jgi:transposase
MIDLRDIILRFRMGDSIKRIHRETGRHKTVLRRLLRVAQENGWLDSESPPTEAHIQAVWEPIRFKSPPPLDAFQADLRRWFAEEHYSYVVIHRLLRERGVGVSETTVRRYLKRLCPREAKPTLRREFLPGDRMEVDFGFLGWVYDEQEGRTRKAWVFSARLCYSRKAYRERVWTQRKEVFFAAHQRAFQFFGGVPRQVAPDNLKAAVVQASWVDPLVNREYRTLAEHYGFRIAPCRPYHPQHKGGVESDIKYVKGSFWPQVKERERAWGHSVPLLVRIFHGSTEITQHPRATRPWQKVVREEHAPPPLSAFLHTTSAGLLRLAAPYGEGVVQFLSQLLQQKAVDGLRPARGVLSLLGRYPKAEVQQACAQCLRWGEVGYRPLKALLQTKPQSPPQFLFARPPGYFDPNLEEVCHG